MTLPFSDFLLFIRKAPHAAELEPTRAPHKPDLQHRKALDILGNVLVVDSDSPGHDFFTAHSGQRTSAYLFGELYTYQENQKPAHRLLADITEDVASERFRPETLNGQFALLLADKASGDISIFADAMGFMPVYMFEGENALVFGSDLLAVSTLGSSRKLDWEGLTSFFSIGYFSGDRTFFQDIKLLRPATRVTVRDGSYVNHEEYWSWSHEPDIRRSYSDTVAEFTELLKNAVNVRMSYRDGDRLALGISGGLDSRTIAACLPKGADVHAYSYGYFPESTEIKIGRAVAEAHRLPFTNYVIESGYLTRLLEPAVRTNEGFADIMHARQVSILSDLGQRVDGLLAGHWGDILCDRMTNCAWNQDVPASKLVSWAYNKVSLRGADWLQRHVCEPHLQGQSAPEMVKEQIASELGRLEEIRDPDIRVKWYKTTQWAFRWTNANLHLFQMTGFPRCVYYDKRLLDFFCTVPSEFVRKRRLQVDFLKSYAPHLARVKWQPYGLNLYRVKYFNNLLIPVRAVRKAKRLLWEAIKKSAAAPIQRNWELQLLNPQGARLLERWLVADGLLLHGFIPKKDIQSLLAEFRSDHMGRANPVCMLLTFSAWLEQYMR